MVLYLNMPDPEAQDYVVDLATDPMFHFKMTREQAENAALAGGAPAFITSVAVFILDPSSGDSKRQQKAIVSSENPHADPNAYYNQVPSDNLWTPPETLAGTTVGSGVAIGLAWVARYALFKRKQHKFIKRGLDVLNRDVNGLPEEL
jgi:hypothetical protein